MKKLYTAGYYLFIAALVSVGVLLIITLFPIPGNYEIKIVLSGSMEPALKTGSIVVVKPVDVYEIGDVITFGKDTKRDVPTTHRIVEARFESGKARFITKGDANDNVDGKEVREDEVIGKVLLSVPYLGFLLDLARKPIGFAFLIGVPAVAIVSDELRKVWREVGKMKKGKPRLSETSAGETDDKQDNDKA
jgi:signal peptidase I